MLLTGEGLAQSETCSQPRVAVRVLCMRYAILAPGRTLRHTAVAHFRNISVLVSAILRADVRSSERAFAVVTKDVHASLGKVASTPATHG